MLASVYAASSPEVVESSADESEPQTKRRKGIPRMRRRRSHIAAEQLGVSPKTYRRLKRMAIPAMFMQALAIVAFLCCDFTPLQVAELHSGVGHIWLTACAWSIPAQGCEIRDSPVWEDALIPEGFFQMIRLIWMLMTGSIARWGTPCSSWIWMSRSKTGRNAVTPGGCSRFLKVGVISWSP